MTAAAPLSLDAPPPRRSPARGPSPCLDAGERAARLAMSIAGAVASLPGLPRRKAAEARQRARAELDEIEALLDVRDVVLPEAGRTDVQRSCWEGFAGPQDDAAEAAALAVWAALGEPAETWLLFWRCALAGGEAMPRGPRAPRWAREEEEREDRFSRIQGTAPRYTFGR